MSPTLPARRVEDLDTPEGHLAFMRSQWRDFAAFAWEKYLNEGRGAIVIDLRHAVNASGGLQVPSRYVADGGERLANQGGWPSIEIAELVRDYDPDLDIVVLFVRLNQEVIYYNASGEMTPPRAYAEKQRRREQC